MSRDLPSLFVSFTSLKEFMKQEGLLKEKLDYGSYGTGAGSSADQEQRLKRGKERHEHIQSIFRGYAELTPICRYKKGKKEVYLIGHVDHYDFEDNILYEIKSQSYFKHNTELVLLQIAFYTYLMNKWFKVNKINHVVNKQVLVLYQGDKHACLSFNPLGDKMKEKEQFMLKVLDKYIKQLK